LTAHIRELQRQISGLKAGVKTVDCGTQVHQYAFVSDQGSQTHQSSGPVRILPRGCIIGRSSAPPAPWSASKLLTFHDEFEDRKARLCNRVATAKDQYRRDCARLRRLRSSNLEAPPGCFAVGKLVRSLPYDSRQADPDDPHFDAEYGYSYDSFTRIHRITAVWSHTDCRDGFEVCQLQPVFPCREYKLKRKILSRFLVPVSAEDYAVAQREYHERVRRSCAERLIAEEIGRSIPIRSYNDACLNTLTSLVYLDVECKCAACERVPLDVCCGSVEDAPWCYRDRFQAPMQQLLSEYLDRVYSKVAEHFDPSPAQQPPRPATYDDDCYGDTMLRPTMHWVDLKGESNANGCSCGEHDCDREHGIDSDHDHDIDSEDPWRVPNRRTLSDKTEATRTLNDKTEAMLAKLSATLATLRPATSTRNLNDSDVDAV
jgi:hypothetical protein